MTISCAIIDDEPLARDLLESYVRKTPFLQLDGKYASAIAALKEVNEKKIQLLFLDIQMPDLNGLEFSKMIPSETRIIFTTAFQQYALDGFRVNALDYLLKPISYSDFLESANKALEWFNLTSAPKTSQSCYQNQDDFIYIKSDYKLIQIYLKDILYIEGLKDYVKIHLETEPRPILSLMSMKSLEERLPKPQFLRVHRSFIVQSSKVKTLDRGIIVFGKERIPVSESYKPALMEFLNEHAV